MATLNHPMCGASVNFPDAVQAVPGGATVLFDYTPNGAGWAGPGPWCEGYIARDPQYATTYDLFATPMGEWIFYDGQWRSGCTLVNGVDGAAGFTIGGVAFAPEGGGRMYAGAGCRSAARAAATALARVLLASPARGQAATTSDARAAADISFQWTGTAGRLAARRPSAEGFGVPAVDALADHLVCLWKLEEATGNRVDLVSGEDLAAHNAPGAQPGKDGLASQFSNSAANGLYRELADLGPLAVWGEGVQLTVSTWLHASTLGYRSIAGFFSEMGGMSSWSLSLGYENRLNVSVATHDYDNAWCQSAPLTAGVWHHVLFTYDAQGHLRLYLDGVLAGTGATYNGGGGLGQPWSPFTLGCGRIYDPEGGTFSYGNSWDGLIDETCVWNTVPDDPDAFAAALWSGGAGAFCRVDTTQRTGTAPGAAAREARQALRRERAAAVVPLFHARTVAPLDALVRLVHAESRPGPAARRHTGEATLARLEFLFGLDPTHAGAAARMAAQRLSGNGFHAPAVDALRESLVCCWKLEEAGGQRLDLVSGENLTPHNAPAAQAGKDGLANEFANSAANGLYRELADLGPLGAWGNGVELTFSTWLYARTLGYRTVGGFVQEMAGMAPWSVSLGYENRFYANVTTPQWEYAYAQSGPIAAGTWHNLVFTFDSRGRLRLYLDGALAGTGTTYSGTGGIAQPWTPFTLGCGQVYDSENNTHEFGNSWDGLIDETCLWHAVPDDPDAFAAALWNGGAGSFLHLDPRQWAPAAVRASLRAAAAAQAGVRAFADQCLSRTASPARARGYRYTITGGSGAEADARARTHHRQAARAEVIYLVPLTYTESGVRTRVRRDLTALQWTVTVPGLDARAMATTADAARLRALVVRLHACHGVRVGAGTQATFAASADAFHMRAPARTTTGEHPGARTRLRWTIPHLASARDTTGRLVLVAFLVRAPAVAVTPARSALRSPAFETGGLRHDAFAAPGWRLVACDPAGGVELDLGFAADPRDGSAGVLADVGLPDGDWEIEARPSEWFWPECRGRGTVAVSVRDGLILVAGIPGIRNLRADLRNLRRVVSWDVAGELLPADLAFAIWTGPASPVDTGLPPVARVPFLSGRGTYSYQFGQAAPLYLAVAAVAGGTTGPQSELFLEWQTLAPSSPPNQLGL